MIVVTIADAKIENCAFSADTHMAECLIIATKGISGNTGRGTFVSLHRRPDNHLEAVEMAKEIHGLKSIRQLEDPPIGGNSIKVGNEIGQALGLSTARHLDSRSHQGFLANSICLSFSERSTLVGNTA